LIFWDEIPGLITSRGSFQQEIKMERFEWVKGVGKATVAMGGGVVTTIAFMMEYLNLSLESTLLSLLIVGVAALFLLLSTLQTGIQRNINDLQTDVNHGFDRVVETLDQQADSEPPKTDGGIDGDLDEQFRDVDPSGNGAFGGMLAGGALGSAFGPPGLVVGGLIGALVGNELEYQNLKEQQKERLEQTARKKLHQRTGLTAQTPELQAVHSPKESDRGMWELEFQDAQNRFHLVLFDPESAIWQYERR
jgi:hypothetical protein